MPVDDQMRRQIIRAVVLVAGLAAAIGLVVALTVTVGLRMAGITGDDTPAPTVAAPDPDETAEQPVTTRSAMPEEPPTSTSPTATPMKPEPKPTSKPIELRAGTQSAGSMERVTLSGEFKGGNGTTLQVQRMEGGSWVEFPTTTSVDGGTFSTSVALGQPGRNRLRVVDADSGKASNPVVITIS